MERLLLVGVRFYNMLSNNSLGEHAFWDPSISIEIRTTEVFSKWLDGLRDLQARARIQTRIERLAMGNPGDVKSIGEGVSELRIDHGPGYRVYYTKRGREVIILLAGGDKRTQNRDIETALRLKRNL